MEKSLFKVSKRVTSLRVKVSNRKYECRMLLINDRYLCIVLLPLIFDFDFCCPWYLLNVMSKVPTLASSVTSVLAIKKVHHVAAIWNHTNVGPHKPYYFDDHIKAIPIENHINECSHQNHTNGLPYQNPNNELSHQNHTNRCPHRQYVNRQPYYIMSKHSKARCSLFSYFLSFRKKPDMHFQSPVDYHTLYKSG